jgi:AraC-like DNA-binding protein
MHEFDRGPRSPAVGADPRLEAVIGHRGARLSAASGDTARARLGGAVEPVSSPAARAENVEVEVAVVERASYDVAMVLGSAGLRRLCRARALLYDVEGAAPRVRELAREIGMSPFHFIRQFEVVFGVTPHQLRQRARLDRAKHLLAFGNHSVTEVCMAVGFTSVGSFSALFKRRLGEAPSTYRRRVRATVQVPARLVDVLYPGCLSLMGRLPPDSLRNFREA